MTTINHPRRTTQPDPRCALIGWTIALGVWISQVVSGHLRMVDCAIADAVMRFHSPMLDRCMQLIAMLGSAIGSLLLLAALLARVWKWGGKRTAWTVAWAYLLGSLLVVVLKGVVNQWRPDANPLASPLEPRHRIHAASFPSGHAFRAAFLGGWLLPRLPESPWLTLQRALIVLAMGLVSVSRIYLQRHWASDVIGSWLLALAMLSLVRCWEDAHRSEKA